MGIFDRLLKPSGPPSPNEPPYYLPLRRGNFADAIPLLRAAMKRDDAHAMAIFATLLAMGRGMERNEQDAADWYRQSAARGELAGQTAYGACLAAGIGVPVDQKEASFWLYRAARAGYRAAADLLADVVLCHQSVVGEHFTDDQLREVLRVARRPKSSEMH